MMATSYAVIHKDSTIRMMSRSGGFFTAISDYVLERSGVVYGCVLNSNLTAEHIRATEKSERDRMRGSKYIQSNMSNVLGLLRRDVEDGKLVLFTGTTCQTAAVRALFPSEPDNLILLDIICHGVPSPLIWKSYVEWTEKKHGGNCTEVDFRNKVDFGWRAHKETFRIHKQNELKSVSREYFRNLFYRHNILRPSCFSCPYKSISRPADISIADCWGIENAAPEMDDNKGVSLVLLESEKGKKLFSEVQAAFQAVEVNIADCMQPSLQKPVKKPSERTEFWIDYASKDFVEILRKYADLGVHYYVVKRLRETKHKLKMMLFRR